MVACVSQEIDGCLCVEPGDWWLPVYWARRLMVACVLSHEIDGCLCIEPGDWWLPVYWARRLMVACVLSQEIDGYTCIEPGDWWLPVYWTRRLMVARVLSQEIDGCLCVFSLHPDLLSEGPDRHHPPLHELCPLLQLLQRHPHARGRLLSPGNCSNATPMPGGVSYLQVTAPAPPPCPGASHFSR